MTNRDVPQTPYATDAHLTEAILEHIWQGDAYLCPTCGFTTPERALIIPHLQQHIDEFLSGKGPFAIERIRERLTEAGATPPPMPSP